MYTVYHGYMRLASFGTFEEAENYITERVRKYAGTFRGNRSKYFIYKEG